jgi:hypothetical protein
MSHKKIGPVDAGVRQIIDGNQIMAAMLALVIKRNLPPVTPMSHQKIEPVDPGVGQKINGNDNAPDNVRID